MAESAMSIGGAWAGLDKGNDDELQQIFLSPGFNKSLNQYNKLFRPGALGYDEASKNYADLFAANSPLAAENAAYYGNIAKGIFSNPATATSTYEQLRSGNLSSLSDVYKNVLDYGLAGQKAKLAAGGYGNTGPSAYDRILSSTMTASNLAPVLNTIYGNLGRDATGVFGADRNWDAYRLGQFAQDPLTGYVDAATAGRAINPFMTKVGMLNAGVAGLGGLMPLYQGNSGGFQVVKGLTSRLNDFDAGHLNAMNNAMSLYTGAMSGGMMGGGMGGAGGAGGGMGGLSSMMGGMGGGQQMAPAAQGYYPQQMPSVPATGGYYQPMMQYQQPAQYSPYMNPNSPALTYG